MKYDAELPATISRQQSGSAGPEQWKYSCPRSGPHQHTTHKHSTPPGSNCKTIICSPAAAGSAAAGSAVAGLAVAGPAVTGPQLVVQLAAGVGIGVVGMI